MCVCGCVRVCVCVCVCVCAGVRTRAPPPPFLLRPPFHNPHLVVGVGQDDRVWQRIDIERLRVRPVNWAHVHWQRDHVALVADRLGQVLVQVQELWRDKMGVDSTYGA